METTFAQVPMHEPFYDPWTCQRWLKNGERSAHDLTGSIDYGTDGDFQPDEPVVIPS